MERQELTVGLICRSGGRQNGSRGQARIEAADELDEPAPAVRERLAQTTVLNLSNHRLDALSQALRYCSGVQSLLLDGNQIARLGFLDQCVRLRRLYLQGNCLEVISGLEGLCELRVLNLARNRITRVEGLEHLEQLEQLQLDNQVLPPGTNALTFDPASLQTVAASLTTLSVAGNGIADPEPLSILVRLESLDLSRNCISAVAALEPVLRALTINNRTVGAVEREFLRKFQRHRAGLAKAQQPARSVQTATSLAVAVAQFEPKVFPHMPPYASQYRDLMDANACRAALDAHAEASAQRQAVDPLHQGSQVLLSGLLPTRVPLSTQVTKVSRRSSP